MLRLFVALALPFVVKAQLSALAGGIPGARWVPPENYPLTLRFIGEVESWRAEEVDAALAAISQLDAQTVDLCFSQTSCILGPLVWDASARLPDRQFPGLVFKTLLGYRDHLYLVQLLAYVGFWMTVGGRYFRSLNPTPSAKPTPSQP